MLRAAALDEMLMSIPHVSVYVCVRDKAGNGLRVRLMSISKCPSLRMLISGRGARAAVWCG